jgi:hypothetical protein
MRGRLAVLTAWAARAVRGLWPDRNPLRRTIDRAEAAVVAGLAVVFLAGIPLVAAASGHYVYGYASRTVAAQRAAWHRVPAKLLTTVPASGYGDQATVPARWTAPDGKRRTGMVPAPMAASTGGTVMVWVDEAGRLTEPPLRPSLIQGQAALAGIFTSVVFGMIVVCVGLLVHVALDRRRLAAWDAKWRATGPQWTRQR